MFFRKLRLLKSKHSLFLWVFTSSREIPCKSRSICCKDVCVDKQILKDTIGSQCGKCGGWIYCENIFLGKMMEHSCGTPDCWWIVVISCVLWVLWMSNDLCFEGLTSVLPLDIHPSGKPPKINRAHTIQVGEFDVSTHGGNQRKTHKTTSQQKATHIDPKTWLSLESLNVHVPCQRFIKTCPHSPMFAQKSAQTGGSNGPELHASWMFLVSSWDINLNQYIKFNPKYNPYSNYSSITNSMSHRMDPVPKVLEICGLRCGLITLWMGHEGNSKVCNPSW